MTLAGLLAISIGINILLTYKLEKSTKKSKKLAEEIRRKSSILGIAMYSVYGKL